MLPQSRCLSRCRDDLKMADLQGDYICTHPIPFDLCYSCSSLYCPQRLDMADKASIEPDGRRGDESVDNGGLEDTFRLSPSVFRNRQPDLAGGTPVQLLSILLA